MKLEKVKSTALSIIEQYPKSKNGEPYLTLKNGRKVFLRRFMRKYGLISDSAYSELDLKRRLNKVEFFDYFVKDFELVPARDENRFLLDSYFHRMVILESKVGEGKKYELLSFHPL